MTCAASSYWLNRNVATSLGKTIGHAILVLLLASFAFLLFGLEGGICIVMAIPLFVPLAILGAVIGFAIAGASRVGQSQGRGMLGCLAMLPIFAAFEKSVDQSPILEVSTQVVVHAPIDKVWSVVIAFPEITEPPKGLFRWGVAYPIRATIDRSGVGACRHCIFSTGEFVEPITLWEPPTRLSFDVTSQPEPMTELSPYKSIHPPHLDGSFRSVRGEFRLSTQTDGSTLLAGSTWYELDIGPRAYWKLWTDWIVHRIHERVLEHIRDISEAE